MSRIRITISNNRYNEIELLANKNSITVEDQIRFLLGDLNQITSKYIVEKALNKYSKGDEFILFDLLGGEWPKDIGICSSIGKKFNKHIRCEEVGIKKIGKRYGRCSLYKII